MYALCMDIHEEVFFLIRGKGWHGVLHVAESLTITVQQLLFS